MDKKNLFTIGELADYQNISRQTLIFYDKTGLFKPACVDPKNGYRYYSAGQLDDLDPILIMKKIGFSLEEIREYMESSNLETSIAVLKKQMSAIEGKLKELALIKSRLKHRCDKMEEAARPENREVSVERAETQYIFCRDVMPPYSLTEVSLATKQCYAQAFRENLPVFLQSGVIVPLEKIRAGRFTEASTAFLPIESSLETESIKKLPAGTCVTIHHFGSYESIGLSYQKLLDYCAAHALTLCSDSYEFCLHDYITARDKNEYITKILFYIQEIPPAP